MSRLWIYACVTIDHIGRRRVLVARDRGDAELLAWTNVEPIGPHQPRNAVMSDVVPASAQFLGHPRAAVAVLHHVLLDIADLAYQLLVLLSTLIPFALAPCVVSTA